MSIDPKVILNQVSAYYSKAIRDFGNSPEGVDWKDISAQKIRFAQIAKIIQEDQRFSLADVGCGVGHFSDFLLEQGFNNFSFVGYDVSPDMIQHCNERSVVPKVDENFFLLESNGDLQPADYMVASGIFNVRGKISDKDWLKYILETINAFHKNSRRGFAFNCLTSYSDKEKMSSELYYADPCFLFDYCKKNFSQNVALLHDYGIWDFTILVRK
jgi:SAM-dependent methyltransferase